MLSVPSAIRIGMGVHAGIVLVQSDRRPDAGALISQHATRLAYLAASGEILLSMPTCARLADQYAMRSEKRHGISLWILESVLESKAVGRMFGRVREFDTLVRLWARLPIAQTPTAMVVRGEAGIGKSLLIRVMSEYVRHTGGVVCTLHSDERHRHTAFYPVFEWITQKLALKPDGDKSLYESTAYQAQLANTIRQSLAPDASVLPELQRRLFPGSERRESYRARGDAASLELMRALIDILTHRTDRRCPLLLVWEDVHAADASSLMVLDTLMRQMQSGPTMVLLTSRDEFVCAGRTRELLLKPLERQALMELVAHRVKGERSSTKLRARIVNESGGVPLYAEEMLRQAARGADAGVTPLMTDLATARLSRLSPAARKAVQFAAVAGDIDIALMLRASEKMEWNANDLPKILDELRQHGLINDQIPADFCYPLIRDAIYHSLSPGQRRRHHAHVAQCLIEGAEPSASTSIAMHLEMAQHGESDGVRMSNPAEVNA